MNANDVYARLEQLGYVLEMVGEKDLRYRKVSVSTVPEPGEFAVLVSEIKNNKAEILFILKQFALMEPALAQLKQSPDSVEATQNYARAAIMAEMPFFDDGLVNIGRIGWERWGGLSVKEW